MAEIRTVTTLRYKRDEITNTIMLYERQLAQAKADLAHIVAAIRLFEATGDRAQMTRYVDTHRLFARGEKSAMCRTFLANGPLSTRDIAKLAMKAKGLNSDDRVLALAIGNQFIHALRGLAKRGHIRVIGKHHAACIWSTRQSIGKNGE